MQASNEILFVEDNGCIVLQDRSIALWFKSLIEILDPNAGVRICVASRYRPVFRGARPDNIFHIELAELSRAERMGLLKRLAEFEQIRLSADDYEFLLNHQQGFPEQAFFTIGLIKEMGLQEVKRHNELLIAFNTDRVEAQVNWVTKTKEDHELLVLLSEFEFISWQFLSSLVDTVAERETIERFLAAALCETIGANREYLRLNDTIRDFVRRTRIDLPEGYKRKLKQHVDEFLKSQEKDDIDASEYLFSVQRAMVSGHKMDFRTLVPSHFLRAMKELYDRKRQYKDVVALADRVLDSSIFFDENITREMRYFLCQSLARLKDKRFLSEIQKLKGPEHNFLMGFYYRLTGRFSEAIERQLQAMNESRTASRARRELVQLYVTLEDFDAAIDLARKNSNNNPSNPFHMHAYLKCLIYSSDWVKHATEIETLIRALKRSSFERAKEMALNAEAEYLSVCKHDMDNALRLIDQAIADNPYNPYPLLTKLSILFKVRDVVRVEETLRILEDVASQSLQFKEAITKSRAQLLALKGDRSGALSILDKELKGIPEKAKEAVRKNVLSAVTPLVVLDDGNHANSD